MMSATNFLAETGQEEDPAELVEARNMALATQASSLPAHQLWLGTITLETWKLFMLRDLQRSTLRMHVLSVKMYPRRGLSALQQWRL
jgi:hypothetical protein